MPVRLKMPSATLPANPVPSTAILPVLVMHSQTVRATLDIPEPMEGIAQHAPQANTRILQDQRTAFHVRLTLPPPLLLHYPLHVYAMPGMVAQMVLNALSVPLVSMKTPHQISVLHAHNTAHPPQAVIIS